jgi:hypothetical protein
MRQRLDEVNCNTPEPAGQEAGAVGVTTKAAVPKGEIEATDFPSSGRAEG